MAQTAPPQSVQCTSSPFVDGRGSVIPGGTKIPAELPLQLHEARWFHMRNSKTWLPFSGCDSLKLEIMHQMMQVLDESTPPTVDVMGSLYEANLKSRTCAAIYWSEKETTFKILRGTWFEVLGDRWYPIEEAEAQCIETKHCDPDWRTKSVKMDITSADDNHNDDDGSQSIAKLQQEIVIGRLALENCDIIWMDDGVIYKQKKDLSTFIVLKIGEALGKGTSFSGICLRRGYKESALDDDGEVSPVGHLVLAVHGIGESLDRSPIHKSTADFREVCTQVAKKYFPDQWNEKRVEFLPVDWRTSLTLDDGMLKRITLHGVKTLRDMLNDSVLDVFYYTSMKYKDEILSGLYDAVNKQYELFIKHHPHFLRDGGTVSVFAHSLGSVIMYDLLHESCAIKNIVHDNPVPPPTSRLLTVNMDTSKEDSVACDGEVDELRRAQLQKLHTLRKEMVELERLLGISSSPSSQHSLDFKVEHLFLVGSPLGMFILMREHESLVKRGHRSSASFIPTEVCRRIHNLHHPSDPVAYRLEPLINEAYANIKPVKIDNASSKPSKTALDHAEGPKTDEMLAAQSNQDQGGSWMSSLINIFPTSKILMLDSDKEDSDSHIPHNERLKERIDFSLKEGLVDISYINAITAHTGYWSSADCAFYVLLQIFKCKRT